ncbi:T9SS type A sorting domain-containing protein, partial [Marinifilum sp. D737]|uniref:T9SS type A sorting domain-containing protein n=1 Tax=Marinifilum sp. D737 TaxID=2969628 RepID=UPI0022759A54
SVEIIFTPTDNSNYNTVSGNINITVDKADATVSAWPAASKITYGQNLSESILTGGTANVEGSFAFTNPSATPNAGTQSVEIIFTPTDNSNYNTVSGNINITVDKADATVSVWPTAGTITYGQTLSESTLSGGTANVEGSFAFTNPSATPDAGTQVVEIIFTPTDASNYNTASGNINITVDKADATVSAWPAASTITYGQALNESILTGETANVDGSFAFANPSATPNAGTQSVEVIFTPNNSDNYNSVSKLISISIDKADQNIFWDQDLSSLMVDDQVQLTAIAETDLPVSYSISDEDIALIEGDLLTILEAGELTITATQEGNQNYNPVEVSRIIIIKVVTGIDDGINKSIELKAYPNPVQRKVSIDGLQRGDKIALYNQLGKMILIKDVQNNKEVFDLSDCKPGMYLFKVVGGKSIRILKI